MKKLGVVLTVICVMLIGALFANAASDITESPNVKVIINGKITTYDDIPVIVDGRTLLPLRAILTNLGVPNDDSHIIWNGKEKSVTVIKDSVKIYLKVDSSTASIDGKDIEIDVAPINYKSRVYIPARFISQSLEKKVFWDGTTTTVTIADEKKFNEVKDILAKSNEALKNITKLKFSLSGDFNYKKDDIENSGDFTGLGECDKTSRIAHMSFTINTKGAHSNVENYITDEKFYTRQNTNSLWEIHDTPAGELDEAFNTNGSTFDTNASDTVVAGLVADTSSPDHIILKGDVYMDQLFNKTLNQGKPEDVLYKKFHMEIYIDKKTNLLSKVAGSVVYGIPSKTGSKDYEMSENVNVTYSDYNGNVNIVIPEELLK